METDAIKKFILQIPFFKAFTDHELTKLVGREKLFRDSKKGGYLFKEGDPGSSLFVLLFGEIDLVKKSEGGTESIILKLNPSPGQVFTSFLISDAQTSITGQTLDINNGAMMP